MSGRLVFVDTETTGLQAHFNEVWEIALIERRLIEHDDQPTQLLDLEHVFHIRPDLTKADPTALRICRYYERSSALDDYDLKNPLSSVPGKGWDVGLNVARKIARLLDGAHMVGAVPSFDAAFLSRFLYRFGEVATWHYHLIDVEALAVGYLAGTGHTRMLGLPWCSGAISEQFGVKVNPEDRHTALGDARWARDLYDAVVPR